MEDLTLHAIKYLTPNDATEEESMEVKKFIENLIRIFGPVIETYPTWHPLMLKNKLNHDHTTPTRSCGYNGVDHTIKFANAFVTCPYSSIKIIESLSESKLEVEYSLLDIKLYSKTAIPIVVYYDWEYKRFDFNDLDNNCNDFVKIPKHFAVPLMMEHELLNWRGAFCGETFERMADYLLGTPRKKASSAFVGIEAGRSIKSMYEAMNKTGMFGGYVD